MTSLHKLSWHSINLVLGESSGQRRTILTDQRGELHSGQLLAIMGPSGCGKTSLLSAIGSRVAYNKSVVLTGNVEIDDTVVSWSQNFNATAMVAQDDLLFSYLTVQETLLLAALLSGVDRQRADETVDAVMKELNLTAAAETIIGSATRRGVSGGEYKRVLIGKALMKVPTVILLDEPTSGLDAFQAKSVVQTLKTLAARNKIVAAVIHQPRSSIFMLFDLLLLLSAGRTMYFGPASQAVQYFAQMGYPCPEHFNPADFFLDLLSVNAKSAALEQESSERVDALARAWADPHNAAKHTQRGANQAETANHTEEAKAADRVTQSGPAVGAIISTRSDSDKSPGAGVVVARWFNAFVLLLWRALVEIFRNYASLVIRTITALFYAVLLSLIYQNLGKDQKSIQDRLGLLFFLLVTQAFSPCFVILDTIPNEKVIISREILSGAYPTSAYFIARVVAELPVEVVLTAMYSSIIYWSVGLNPLAECYVVFLLTILLVTLCSFALGFWVSALCPTREMAEAVGTPLLIILLLFGGFYINTGSLPPGSEWVRYISMVYWGFQALVINEFSGETFFCDAANIRVGCIRTGDDEIANLGFQTNDLGLAMGMLVVLIVGFLMVAYLSLLFTRKHYQEMRKPEERGNAL